MSQPVRNKHITPSDPKKTKPSSQKPKTTKKYGLDRFKSADGKYGTSKLEDRFAKRFLDKLGINYIRQYKMGGTGRYCDFAVPEHNILIEVDGDYFHAYGLLEEDMDAIQKKNHKVDLKKDRWALENNFIMVRIWEHDIIKHPSKVMKRLKELFGIQDKPKNKIKKKK